MRSRRSAARVGGWPGAGRRRGRGATNETGAGGWQEVRSRMGRRQARTILVALVALIL